jgi:hypothetical protein
VIIACASSQFYWAHGMKTGESARYMLLDLRHTFLLTWTAPFNEPALAGGII